MMLITGIRRNKSLTGFTLVEVMVSAVVLAVGFVFLFEAFLMSLDIVGIFNDRLNAQWFAHEKIFQAQYLLDQPGGAFMPLQESGTVILGAKKFNWQVSLSLIDVQQELYALTVVMNWKEGGKERRMERATFVKRNLSNAAL